MLALQKGFYKMRIPAATEEEGSERLAKCQGAACAAPDRRLGQRHPDQPAESRPEWPVRRLVVGTAGTYSAALIDAIPRLSDPSAIRFPERHAYEHAYEHAATAECIRTPY